MNETHHAQTVAPAPTYVAAEYEAVREGPAGLLRYADRRLLIELAGGEVVPFLNGLITNDVKALPPGEWMNAAFPNVQGRLAARVRILRRAADSFYVETEGHTHERVLQNLSRFTLAGDFRVTDTSAARELLSVQGPAARAIVERVYGADAARVEPGKVMFADDSILLRATHTCEDGFDIYVPVAAASQVAEDLRGAGAVFVGEATAETLRVEAGFARYGVDVDETTVVLEAGMDDAVSFTKGCYLGQEVIARVHWRGHVARRLAGVIFDTDAPLVSLDARLRSPEGKELARLTSAVFSPRLGKTIALGLVKYSHLAPGTEVVLTEDDGSIKRGQVADLPFVRGSWPAANAAAATAGSAAEEGA